MPIAPPNSKRGTRSRAALGMLLAAATALPGFAGKPSPGVYRHDTGGLIRHSFFVAIGDSAGAHAAGGSLSVFQHFKGEVIKVAEDTLAPAEDGLKGKKARVFGSGDSLRLDYSSQSLRLKSGDLKPVPKEEIFEAENGSYYHNARAMAVKRPGVKSNTYDREARQAGIQDSLRCEPGKFKALVDRFNATAASGR